MSWLLNLFETYESNIGQVGVMKKKYNGQEYTLLPISHTTQTAHIEVEITEDGEFHSAAILDKSDANTLIPCTDEAASRAGSKIAPYPLHDKLSYVAGDYVAYGGEIKKEEPFQSYIKQLEGWANSPYSHPKIVSIFTYLRKGQLVKDLVERGFLAVDANNHLIEKWDKKYEHLYPEKPKIFSAVSSDQFSAFIRFNVYSLEKQLSKVWNDAELYDSFISYYKGQLGGDNLCYVTGQLLPSTERHANKLRNSADKAKLISSNDNTGFTFRGRFKDSSEAASISYDVSQKAHNALKWLINRQGKIIDQRVFLIWGSDNPDIIDITDDPFDFDFGQERSASVTAFTGEEFAREFAKSVDGYRSARLSESKANVNIMVLDSATTGRMAVLYYRNMDKHLYLNRLIEWHTSCVWLHRYRKNDQGGYSQFFGAPSTKDIAFAAYGPRANEKIVKGLMERMLPCIIDGQQIPRDIVTSALQRASNPVSMEKWEWEKTLSITCALLNRREEHSVSLDKNNYDRSYLFGRMLAVADVLERSALGDEKRATNAIRYMNSFAQHPERTWKTIQASLQPYLAKLGTNAIYLTKIIDEVASKMRIEDFNNKPLTGRYLLGFYSQRHEIYQKKEKNIDEESDQS